MVKQLKMKKVYFFHRELADEKYDSLGLLTWTKKQAWTVLEETVKNPHEWVYSHMINLDKDYEDD